MPATVNVDPSKFDATLRQTVNLASLSAQLRDVLVQWRAATEAASRPILPGQQDPKKMAADLNQMVNHLALSICIQTDGFKGLVVSQPLKIAEG